MYGTGKPTLKYWLKLPYKWGSTGDNMTFLEKFAQKYWIQLPLKFGTSVEFLCRIRPDGCHCNVRYSTVKQQLHYCVSVRNALQPAKLQCIYTGSLLSSAAQNLRRHCIQHARFFIHKFYQALQSDFSCRMAESICTGGIGAVVSDILP